MRDERPEAPVLTAKPRDAQALVVQLVAVGNGKNSVMGLQNALRILRGIGTLAKQQPW
jgi:hypothetical protein